MSKNHSLEDRYYQADRKDAGWNTISTALIQIFSDEGNLWRGHYGSINKIKVWLDRKELLFAEKSFKNKKDTDYALQMYQAIKLARIPTRTTYRHLRWTNKVLMTLWNREWALVFSPHNESEDREQVKDSQLLARALNKQTFFEHAYTMIFKATEKNLILPWDSYFLRIKDMKCSLLIWDFDQVCTWNRSTPQAQRMEENIKEFFWFLAELAHYFWEDYRESFFDFLKKKQESWESILSDLDLTTLYHQCRFIWGN